MAKSQVHFKCRTYDKSSSISNCNSMLGQMIFGEIGVSGNTASRFIWSKPNLHHIKSIYGSVKKSFKKKKLLRQSRPRESSRPVDLPDFLQKPWPIEIIVSHTPKQMNHSPTLNHPFFSLAHDWLCLWCMLCLRAWRKLYKNKLLCTVPWLSGNTK